MKGYSELNVFSKQQLMDFSIMTQMMKLLPADPKSTIRCHELARAAQLFLKHCNLQDDWVVRDGKYSSVNHSWLYARNPTRHNRWALLDIYSVGSMPMVQIRHDFRSLNKQYQQHSLDYLGVDIDWGRTQSLYSMMRELWH